MIGYVLSVSNELTPLSLHVEGATQLRGINMGHL